MKKQNENQIVDGDKWFEDAMKAEEARNSNNQLKKTVEYKSG